MILNMHQITYSAYHVNEALTLFKELVCRLPVKWYLKRLLRGRSMILMGRERGRDWGRPRRDDGSFSEIKSSLGIKSWTITRNSRMEQTACIAQFCRYAMQGFEVNLTAS